MHPLGGVENCIAPNPNSRHMCSLHSSVDLLEDVVTQWFRAGYMRNEHCVFFGEKSTFLRMSAKFADISVSHLQPSIPALPGHLSDLEEKITTLSATTPNPLRIASFWEWIPLALASEWEERLEHLTETLPVLALCLCSTKTTNGFRQESIIKDHPHVLTEAGPAENPFFEPFSQRLNEEPGSRVLRRIEFLHTVTQRQADLQQRCATLATEADQCSQNLKIAREQAETATRTRRRFLANVSHEIRTPLHGMLGSCNLLRETMTTPEQKRLVDLAVQSAKQLMNTLDSVLDFSGADSGRLVRRHTEFAVHDLIKEALTSARALATDKKITWELNISPDVPTRLSGDLVHLKRVILSLLGNAIKFTPEGSIRLEVGVTSATVDAITLEIRICDTGPGVPRDRIRSVFQPFIQVDSSPTRTQGGLGLGLAMTKELVNLLGGNIGVDCPTEGGSIFWFTCVLSRPAHSCPMAADVPYATLQTTEGIERGLRVLVVEDDPVSREILVAILHELGCEITSVINGIDALQLTRTQTFPVIFMDIHMPEMDGQTAIRLMRRQGSKSHIVALSADSVEDHMRSWLHQGASSVITKPCSVLNITEALRHRSQQ